MLVTLKEPLCDGKSMGGGLCTVDTCQVHGALGVDSHQRWLPTHLPIPGHMSQPCQQEAILFSLLLNLGWPCNVRGPIECGRSDTVPAPSFALKRRAASAFFLLESSCHAVRKLQLSEMSLQIEKASQGRAENQASQSTANTQSPNVGVRSFGYPSPS